MIDQYSNQRSTFSWLKILDLLIWRSVYSAGWPWLERQAEGQSIDKTWKMVKTDLDPIYPKLPKTCKFIYNNNFLATLSSLIVFINYLINRWFFVFLVVLWLHQFGLDLPKLHQGRHPQSIFYLNSISWVAINLYIKLKKIFWFDYFVVFKTFTAYIKW